MSEGRLSEAELAERAGTTVEEIRRLRSAGVLAASGESGPYRAGDVLRVQVARGLEEGGISLSDLGRSVREGALSLNYLDLLPEPPPLTGRTHEDHCREHDLPLDLAERVFVAFGLPIPRPEDPVREDDASVYPGIRTLVEAGWSTDDIARAARVFGESIRRLSQFQVDIFHNETEARYREAGVPESEILDRAVAEVGVRTGPFGRFLITWLYDRHSEGYVIQHRLDHAEAALDEIGLGPQATEGLPPAIVFADLTGYTRISEERGDLEAAGMARRLASVVQEHVHRRGGRVVKWLGDGVMLHFPGPDPAVRCSLDLVEHVPAADLPPAHIGVASGPVIYGDGDYYGRTVNLAARIAGYAGPGQVLVSETTAAAARDPGLRFEPLGPVPLKGISEPVSLHRARIEGDA